MKEQADFSATLSFESDDKAEAGRLAADLQNFLRTERIEAKAELARSNQDAMDLGSTIVLLFGTRALGQLAKGVAGWLHMRGDPALTIKTKKGEIRVPGKLSPEQRHDIVLKALELGAL